MSGGVVDLCFVVLFVDVGYWSGVGGVGVLVVGSVGR